MAEVEYRNEDGPESPLSDEIQDNVKRAKDHQRDWRDEAIESFDFYAGDQYSDDERAYLEEQLRPAITFNRVGPVIDAVHGHQINNEQDVKFLPRESSDDPMAELYSEVLRWADDLCDAPDEVADAFMDTAIAGMGWCEVYMSYDEDPDGKLYSASHVPSLEMGWDPTARKRNISDARYVFRERWWKRKEAEARWPELRNIVLSDTDVEDMQAGMHDASEAFKYENDSRRFYDPHKREVKITHYQWWEKKKIYRVLDRNTGRVIELSPGKFEKLRESLDAMGTPYVQQMKRKYFEAYLAGNHVLESNPMDTDAFTYLCITGKRDNNRNYWFGVVKGMKDPQRWSNKFFAEMQDFMASNRQGGVLAEEDAFTNVRKAEEDWNRNDAFILLAPGAIGANKIKERQQINYPSGLDRLMEIAISSIPDTSGINLEMLGMVDRNQPGVLEAQRKRASVNILAHFFKSLQKFQRARGRLALHYIQNYLSDGRTIRITGQQGQKLIQLNQNPNPNAKYDIIVDEAPSSPNQKEETFAILSNLLPFLLKMGLPAPPEILDYVPLPKTMVQNWKQAIQNQKPDPVQMAKAAKEQSAAMLNQAKTQTEQADAQEAMADAKQALADAEYKLAQARREMANIENDEIEAISKLD